MPWRLPARERDDTPILFDIRASESGDCALEPSPGRGHSLAGHADLGERLATVQGRASMNSRVFLLIGAMAVFGALLSSDGHYQTEQVALA